ARASGCPCLDRRAGRSRHGRLVASPPREAGRTLARHLHLPRSGVPSVDPVPGVFPWISRRRSAAPARDSWRRSPRRRSASGSVTAEPRHTHTLAHSGDAVTFAAAASAFIPALAHAHDGSPPAPHDLWRAWSLEPLELAGLALA